MSKTLLITGAAGTIGTTTAQYFLQQGWNVVATARNSDKLGTWAQSPNVAVLSLDVTNEQSVASAVREAERSFGSIDVLLNCAGVGFGGPLEATSTQQFEQHFQTNVFGLARVIRTMLPLFRRQRHGTIINMSSVSGRFGLPFLSPYNAGKFAVEGLSESLRFELRPLGIKVKLIEPGGIRSTFSPVFVRHEAYEPDLSAVIERVRRPDPTLPGPEPVAKLIWRAATDGSQRLRYKAVTKGALAINRILSEELWYRLIQKSFNLKKSK
ncbi:SDR family oxidoreductase [Granulicella sp. dw_53]|uniref:SDR family oxidoreductase n=1 Tax=Granulicella sp. dw_53 TaxID=2719792 RepID=UPI001BD4141A|nr:SDR family oxidoreductase [Granulicella sp. dw_53]